MQKKLVILEMANNHMGDFNHGIKIIEEFYKITNKYNTYFDFAIKFQFRNLETFIHPYYKERTDIKYVKRFSETKLSDMEFLNLKKKSEDFGFLTICTGFDEQSVEKIIQMQFDILKIASCSFTDWPLLNKISEYDLPIIASTAGSSLTEIDNVVSFFTHRNKNLTIMHCVGEYPTTPNKLQLNQIDLLKNRYQNLKIGYSTHELPTEYSAIQIAIAKNVDVVEKHIGVNTEQYSNNEYSVTPEQLDIWLQQALNAIEMCGISNIRYDIGEKEKLDLQQFKRGVYVNKDIKKGDIINRSNVFYAFPNTENQVLANNMSKYNNFIASNDISKNLPVLFENVTKVDTRNKVWDEVQKIKKFLLDSNVVFPGKAILEISHHYGIENFDKIGISMITIINREYCKKLIIVLPGQTHPEQYHKQKEETFLILFGDIDLTIDNISYKLSRGDIKTIETNQRHKFYSENGCIIEEVSTTHFKNDSFYTDEEINKMENRKTEVTYWL